MKMMITRKSKGRVRLVEQDLCGEKKKGGGGKTKRGRKRERERGGGGGVVGGWGGFKRGCEGRERR